MLLAGVSAHAADIAAGKEKAELCVGCHGENGISQMENIPSLAGQLDQFIQWQLVYFRAGARKNEHMQPIVEQLTNEDIRNLGAYFASLAAAEAGSRIKTRTCRRKGAQAAAGRRCASAISTTTPAPRRWPASPASARTICRRRCATTSRAIRSGGGQAAMAEVAHPLAVRKRLSRSRITLHIAVDDYFSASGCKSRTRLFSRSSTTWV